MGKGLFFYLNNNFIFIYFSLSFENAPGALKIKDVRYSYVVDQQPIGRLLFRRFCDVNSKYQRYNSFLDWMDKYEVVCKPVSINPSQCWPCHFTIS